MPTERGLVSRLTRSFFTWLWDWVIEHWPALAVTAGGGIMTYLASIQDALKEYGPLAWGTIGILSALSIAWVFVMISWAQKIKVRAKYDDLLLEHGSVVNPLDSTFERKRIFLNDFVLPSMQNIDNKTFIDCDLIGPSNVYFVYGNTNQSLRLPRPDAVWLGPKAIFFNGITITNCIFKNCSWQRVTIFASIEHFKNTKEDGYLNWIGIPPTDAHIEERNAFLANAKIREIKDAEPPEEQKPARLENSMDDLIEMEQVKKAGA